MHSLRRSLQLSFLSFCVAPLAAQVPLAGDVSDQAGSGPLLSGVVYHVVGAVQVPAGETLTVQPGAIVKVEPNRDWQVHGTLSATGTALAPIVFTSIFDDTAGGDTNGDGGASAPGPGDWPRLYFWDSSDASVLEHVEVRYAGGVGATAIELFRADIVLHDSLVRDSAGAGLDLGAGVNGALGAAWGASIERNTFTNNLGDAIEGVPVDLLPNLLDNSGSGNGGNWVTLVYDGFVDADLSIGPRNGLDGVIHGSVNFEVPVGVTLTLAAGTILKMSTFLGGAGALIAQGTAQEPVVFTSEADDSAGGDSNGDGVSAGTPGSWASLRLSGSSALHHTRILFAGADAAGTAVNLVDGTPSLYDCVIAHSSSDALRFSALVIGSQVERCTFEDNADEAIALVPAEVVPGLLDNQASGNGANWARVQQGGPFSSSPTWGTRNGLGGTLYLPSSLIVAAGRSLTLTQGLVLKLGAGVQITIQGEFHVQGTASSPVVLTDIRDDSVGGDTNSDLGATAPAPGGWGKLYLQAGGGAVQIEHLTCRYGGAFHPAFEPGMLHVDNALAELRHVALERSAGSGLELGAANVTERFCIVDCDQSGVRIGASSCVLRHFTCAGNGGHGVHAGLGAWFTGGVENSIAWGNALGAWHNLDPGEVRYSDGDAALDGVDGNLFLDPLFVLPTNADAALQPGSPCLDAGDPLAPLDPDGTRADMGCAYSDGCAPEVFCEGQTGVCPVALDFLGSASTSSGQPFLIRLNRAPSGQNGLFFYAVGSPALPNPIAFGNLCLGSSLRRTLVASSGPGGPCGGRFSFDFNSWIASGVDPLLVEGATVVGQWWYREPAAPNGAALSPATRFAICP